MEKAIRRQTKVQKFEPILDVEEFNALQDLLFELMKENYSACATVLGINRLTFRKWETTPPRWPWWNLVLRHVIKLILAGLIQRRGLTGKHRRRVLEALSRIPNSSEYAEEINNLAYDFAGAEAHLRRLLARKGMFWDEIRLPANCGGYSPKTLRVAAKNLDIIKTQEGYGERKRSYWRLPDQDDD